MKKCIVLLLTIFITNQQLVAQSYFNGLYQVKTQDGMTFFIFSRKDAKIKAKYYVQNPQTLGDLYGKTILLVCSGAFSVNWDPKSPPIGICVEKGRIINRNVDDTMDGVVIVYNGGAQKGGIAVSNLEKEPINTPEGSFWLRNNSDKLKFLQWATEKEATVFQTQLLYSTKGYEFSMDKRYVGNTAERRMLAICRRNNGVEHIVIDSPRSDYLNNTAKRIVEVLQRWGYEIVGLLNLDTGGRDYVEVYDDQGNTIYSKGSFQNAINLLIYYID